MKTKPRVGFLGVGWIGRKRLESLVSRGIAEVVAIADPLESNRDACVALAPHAELLESLDGLLERELDGIVIATPSALHATQAITALDAGCGVFCQKPLARSAAEVGEILAAARRNDRLLGIDLSYRHTRALRAVRDLVTSGEIGHVFAADLVFHNAYGPDKAWCHDLQLAGGGCVIDLGVHLVDAALWILGGHVARVSSCLFREGQPLEPGAMEVEDFATAQLELDSCAVANLACSWRLHAGQPAVIGMTFHGTKGGAAFENVGGSFTDFVAKRFTSTNCERLVAPPDDWGGGAIIAWAERLAQSPRYDVAIEEHRAVAEALDGIYGRALSPSLLVA